MFKKLYNIIKIVFIISIFLFSNIYISSLGISLYLFLKYYIILYIICKILQIILEITFELMDKHKKRSTKN